MNLFSLLLATSLILACYPCEACGGPVGDSAYIDFINEPQYAYCADCCRW